MFRFRSRAGGRPGYPATPLPRNEAKTRPGYPATGYPAKRPVLSAVDFRFVLPLQGIRACNTWSVIGLTILTSVHIETRSGVVSNLQDTYFFFFFFFF